VLLSLVGGAGLLAWGPPSTSTDGPPGAIVAQDAPKAQNQPDKGPEDKTDDKEPRAVKEVLVVQPVVREITPHEDFTGRTEPAATVQLRSRVSGYLVKVHVKEGDAVKKGDVLFEIDPRVYQAELDRANAVVAQSETRLQRAEADRKRAEALAARSAISKEEADQIAGRFAEAQAEVRVAQASRELAALNLSFTRITAPIGGIIGRRPLDAGNLVKADDAVLATIVTSNPMVVNCDIDERTALQLRRAFRAGKSDAKEWPSLAVAMGLADEEGFPHEGKIESAASQIDSKSGTLRLRMVFPNPDGLLVRGLFCRVRLTTGKSHKGLTIPGNSTVWAINGRLSVWIVNEKNILEERPVETGARQDGMLEIKKGVTASDWIVHHARGLRLGMTVRPRKTAPGEENQK
jgi:RND family efflux transporter MFP subunit